jgi:hypothetical protein
MDTPPVQPQPEGGNGRFTVQLQSGATVATLITAALIALVAGRAEDGSSARVFQNVRIWPRPKLLTKLDISGQWG